MLHLPTQRQAYRTLEGLSLESSESGIRALVRGPSGSGKSWILRELALQWPGPAILATGEAALQERSYGAFWLGISTAGPKLSSRQTLLSGAAAAGKMVPVVGSLVSYLTDLLGTRTSRSRRDRTLYLKKDEFEILSHLDALSSRGHLLLISDDLQYWDQDSLQLLYLIASSRLDEAFPFLRRTCLVVGLMDEGEQTPRTPIAEILGLLSQEVTIERIPLDDLPAALALFGFAGQLSQSQLEMLHLLSGGHLELLRQLAAHLTESTKHSLLPDYLVSVDPDVEAFLATILSQRLRTFGAAGQRAHNALERAAVIGKSFTLDELRCLLEPDEFHLSDYLETARSLGLITNEANHVSFRHEILRNCLLPKVGHGSIEINKAFADCLSLLRPFDYFARAKHLSRALEASASARLSFAGLYKRRRDGLPIPAELSNSIFEELDETGQGESGRLLLDAYEKVLTRQFPEAISFLESCENTDHPYFVAERLFLLGLARLQSVVTEDRRDALKVLKDCDRTGHGEKELEIRIKLTLLTAHVHLEDWDSARSLDRQVSLLLHPYVGTDPGAREALEIHRRKSGMLYGAEVSAERCRQATLAFGPSMEGGWPPRNPVQYFMALCNLSGNLMVAGEFSESERVARLGLDVWFRLPQAEIPRLEKCVNNVTVASVLAGHTSHLEATAILDHLREQNAGGIFSRLIRSNCEVFRALSGDSERALLGLRLLEQELSDEGVEDTYYDYFIRSNLSGLLHVQGMSQEARVLWSNLTSKIPQIPASDRHYLVERQKLQEVAFDEVKPGDALAWDSFLRERWPLRLGPGWDFYGRGFLLTDTQIWLES